MCDYLKANSVEYFNGDTPKEHKIPLFSLLKLIDNS